MNAERISIWKEIILTYLKEPSLNFPGETEENHIRIWFLPNKIMDICSVSGWGKKTTKKN
jgi:hypothetical protein